MIGRRPRQIFLGLWLVVFFASATFAPPFVSASTWRGDELLRRFRLAPWRIGSFRLEPRLVLSDFGYDSNIYYQKNAIEDYSFTFGPAVTAFAVVKKKIVFSASESPRYVYFYETARERTWNNYLQGNVSLLLNDFFIQGGVHRNNARERWNYEIDIRPRLRETGIEGSLLWQASLKTSFSVAVHRTRYDYENLEFESFPIADRLNRDEILVNGTGYYQWSSKVRAFADFEYGEYKFSATDNPRDSISRGVYGGLSFSSLGKIRGQIRLGYKSFDTLKRDRPDFKGLVGNTNISLAFIRSLTFRLSYQRNLQFSVWYDNPYYIENSAGGGASLYILRKKVRLDYDYTRASSVYPTADATSLNAPSGVPLNRRDDIEIQGFGLFFRLKRDVGIGLQAGHYHRKVNVYDWNVNRDFIGLNLTYEF
jgi:hypothetical protein